MSVLTDDQLIGLIAWHRRRKSGLTLMALEELQVRRAGMVAPVKELESPREVESQHVDMGTAILFLEDCPRCKNMRSGDLVGRTHYCGNCHYSMPVEEWPAEKGLYLNYPGAKKWPSYQRWLPVA